MHSKELVEIFTALIRNFKKWRAFRVFQQRAESLTGHRYSKQDSSGKCLMSMRRRRQKMRFKLQMQQQHCWYRVDSWGVLLLWVPSNSGYSTVILRFPLLTSSTSSSAERHLLTLPTVIILKIWILFTQKIRGQA